MLEKHESVPQETINIGGYTREETGITLSNFAPTPITLDDKSYPNVEAFWQCLYFPEGSARREEVSQMDARAAKKAGRKKPEGLTHIDYQGKRMEIGSPEHHELMARAIEAKLEQNDRARELLTATGDKILTHVIIQTDGTQAADSKSIPAAVFTKILMDLRNKFRG